VRESGDVVKTGVLGYASRLRFPKLLLLTTVLFVVDLFIPDFIPFIDEILLGLAALMFAMLRTSANQAVRNYTSPRTLEGTTVTGKRDVGKA
jgi:hypothetical protein